MKQLEIEFPISEIQCQCQNGNGINCNYEYNCTEEKDIWKNIEDPKWKQYINKIKKTQWKKH